MAASHMLITTQTEAHQHIRETLRGNLGCLPYARLLQGMAAPIFWATVANDILKEGLEALPSIRYACTSTVLYSPAVQQTQALPENPCSRTLQYYLSRYYIAPSHRSGCILDLTVPYAYGRPRITLSGPYEVPKSCIIAVLCTRLSASPFRFWGWDFASA